MPNASTTTKENLQELEKLVKKIIRKGLKDNTLDYTVQYSISSLDPSKIKYSAMISSPSRGVQPITFVHDSYNELKSVLEASITDLNRENIELTFHQDRVNMYTNKIEAHNARIKQIESGEAVIEEDDGIEMEQV